MKSLSSFISTLQDDCKEIFYRQVEKPFDQQIDEFEKAMARLLGTTQVIALNSGTSAIHLSLRMLDVKPGDLVLCSDLTFVASANPIRYLGADPILVDCDESWNMDPELLRSAILKSLAANKKPKAIIVVHLYGMPAEMNSIMQISREFDIPLIEDAAHALGATFGDKPIGTMGEFGVISFNNNKIITALGGGLLICKNEDSVQRAQYLATQAKDNIPYYHHREVGFNYRISPLNASMGLAQLSRLEGELSVTRSNYEIAYHQLEHHPDAHWQLTPQGAEANRWRWGLILLKSNPFEIENLRKSLHSRGQSAFHMMYPLHNMPIFRNCSRELSGKAQMFFEKGLVFPGPVPSEQLPGILQLLDLYLRE